MKSRDSNRLPPYLTYAAWRRLLQAVQENIPLQFDRSYFRDLGFSDSTALTARGTLLFLGLMSDDSRPTEKLVSWVKAEGKTQTSVLKEIVSVAYQPVLGDLDVEHATLGQVEECFRKCGAEKNVGHKCLSFFLALAKDAAIGLSPNLLNRSRVGTAQKVGPKVISARRRRVSYFSPRNEPNKSEAAEWDLASKLPAFDPNWPKEVREEWFDRLGALMLLMQKFPSFDAQWPETLKLKWFDSLREMVGKSPSGNPVRG
jgi:hypothetical protein